jgi:hypothetical protein
VILLDSELERSLAIAELMSLVSMPEEFIEKYKTVEPEFDSENIETLLRTIESNFMSGYKAIPLEEIFKGIYHDDNRAIYKAKYLEVIASSDPPVERYEEILPYAQSNEEKLEVLGKILLLYLTQYDPEKIKPIISQIKELKGEV